ncbi:MAG: type II secretion system protein GspC [Gammaproteobacteria bacterium]|nr:type II secretion system protein GspC [Gammaproteobacteria bacterium]
MQLDASLLQRLNKPEPWAKAIATLLVVVSLLLLAKLTWLWVDAFTADYTISPPTTTRTTNTTATNQVSVQAIVSKHLFGDVNAKPEEVAVIETAATETNLPLKLRGIYAFDDDARASAIIEVGGGDQEMYFIGETIKNARGAKLHQVLPTKVILNRSGQLESLTLEQEDSVISMDERKPAILKTDDAKKDDRVVVDNPRIQRDLTDIRRKLETDPQSLMDMIRVEPVMENGVLQGVKIAPGKERRLFSQLQLRRNDIVTSINGIPLTDMSQLSALRESLTTAKEVNISLLRNGQAQEVVVRLDGVSDR